MNTQALVWIFPEKLWELNRVQYLQVSLCTLPCNQRPELNLQKENQFLNVSFRDVIFLQWSHTMKASSVEENHIILPQFKMIPCVYNLNIFPI